MAEIEYPLHFIRADGFVWTAETPEEAAGCGADRHHREVVRRRDENGVVLWEQVIECEWIARDSFGRIVEGRDIPDAKRATDGWWNRRRTAARAAAERGLPIPETGRKGRRGPFRRVAPYVGELRDFQAFAAELADCGLQDRMVVRLRNVGPAPYEDGIWRKTERNWKTQRTTRWKDA
jgi:hypothetical protein